MLQRAARGKGLYRLAPELRLLVRSGELEQVLAVVEKSDGAHRLDLSVPEQSLKPPHCPERHLEGGGPTNRAEN